LNPSIFTSSSRSAFIFEYGKGLENDAAATEMRTQVFTPASFTALTSTRFKSKSMACCADIEPAAPRVVAKAEENIDGAGVMVLSVVAQVPLSVLICAVRAEESLCKARRAIACIMGTCGDANSVERI
jgi:hypothetical protein